MRIIVEWAWCCFEPQDDRRRFSSRYAGDLPSSGRRYRSWIDEHVFIHGAPRLPPAIDGPARRVLAGCVEEVAKMTWENATSRASRVIQSTALSGTRHV